MRVVPFRFDAQRGSIRTRLMVWNVCTLALILASLGGTIHYLVRRSLRVSVDNELKARAVGMRMPPDRFPPPPGGFMPGGGGLAISVGNGPPMPGPGPFVLNGGPPPSWPSVGPPPPMPDMGRQRLGNTNDPYRPRMFDLQGRPFGPSDQEGPRDLDSFRQAARGEQNYANIVVDNEPLRLLSWPVRHRGQVISVLQLTYPLTEVNRAISGMDRVLLALIPVALLLAAMGGALLTDRALRPVRDIVQTAERIEAQQLSQRLPVAGEDEFSHLATTFNEMLARLEVAFAQRESLVQQLEKLIEQERRFTADASHELKTPLTIIKANTSLMLQSSPSEADYREMVTEVDHAADTMSRLVHDLLLLARYDEGQLGRNISVLSVREVLKEAQQRVPNPHAIPVLLEVEADDPTLAGNHDEIVRLFSNLLENAVRYTPAGGEVRVTAQSRPENILIQVADTGIGIAAEHLSHLGERFYRVNAARSHSDGGTGLGLSICKSIVEAHHGVLTIRSTPGKGTTVSVTLPRAELSVSRASA